MIHSNFKFCNIWKVWKQILCKTWYA